jgi:ketosteroid isomerase-like protein
VAQTATQQNLAAVRSAYDAYASKELEALLALLDDDFEFRQSELVPWGGSYRGREGMIEFLGKITTHVDSVVEPEEFVEAEDCVVVIGRSRGTVKAGGRPFDVRAVHIWQIRDGRLLRLEAYLDTPAMTDALAA